MAEREGPKRTKRERLEANLARDEAAVAEWRGQLKEMDKADAAKVAEAKRKAEQAVGRVLMAAIAGADPAAPPAWRWPVIEVLSAGLTRDADRKRVAAIAPPALARELAKPAVPPTLPLTPAPPAQPAEGTA